MSNQKKLPAFQFYPGDWKRDIGVQSLSFNDRHVWIEILMLMHDSEERGVLLLNGKPMPQESIARNIGITVLELETSIKNISDSGVCSYNKNGAMFSRRMVRDEYIRQIRRKAGSLGGNPALLDKQNSSKPKANQKKTVKQNPTPSSSSSISTSTKGSLRSPFPANAGGSGSQSSTEKFPKAEHPKTPVEASPTAPAQGSQPKSAKPSGKSAAHRATIILGEGKTYTNPDQRYKGFKEAINSSWERLANGSRGVSNSRNFHAALSALLRHGPDIAIEDLGGWLSCRERSEINRVDPPENWIKHLPRYIEPLSIFFQPLSFLRGGSKDQFASDYDRDNQQ